ncbi:MAG: hypothetical protein K5686_08470, partial [Lachnospiraceae bacterium]|nr:hypothetical protein [Lachnospiraceae bacterium]
MKAKQFTRKLMALFMSIVPLMGMVPETAAWVSAAADDEQESISEERGQYDEEVSLGDYGLAVGGKVVTSENLTDIPITRGHAEFNPDTNTLTFGKDDKGNDAFIDQELYIFGSESRNYAAIAIDKRDLTIKGTVKIKCDDRSDGEIYYGIYAEGSDKELVIDADIDIEAKDGTGIETWGTDVVFSGGNAVFRKTDYSVMTHGSAKVTVDIGMRIDPEEALMESGNINGDIDGEVVISEIIDEYDLHVGDVRVTEKNMTDIPIKSGHAEFDPDTNTLSFDKDADGKDALIDTA